MPRKYTGNYNVARIDRELRRVRRGFGSVATAIGEGGGAPVPSQTQFLGYYMDPADVPAPDENTYGKWHIIREAGGISKEYICHQNSDTFVALGAPKYEWILRSQGRG